MRRLTENRSKLLWGADCEAVENLVYFGTSSFFTRGALSKTKVKSALDEQKPNSVSKFFIQSDENGTNGDEIYNI